MFCWVRGDLCMVHVNIFVVAILRKQANIYIYIYTVYITG